MRSYQEGLPRETLPPSWGPVEVTDERIAYRGGSPPIEVAAVRTSADHTHPSLGVGRCWELRYRYSVGEIAATDTIDRVSTRRAALDGLLECMRIVHDELDRPTDPHAVRRVLGSVSSSTHVTDHPSPKR